ncbi:hypothetical protein SESBI_10781 [Sesbania bispinosa]|nr:hypothetical protein SESBI_10781 [Sesbania bispinosa]
MAMSVLKPNEPRYNQSLGVPPPTPSLASIVAASNKAKSRMQGENLKLKRPLRKRQTTATTWYCAQKADSAGYAPHYDCRKEKAEPTHQTGPTQITSKKFFSDENPPNPPNHRLATRIDLLSGLPQPGLGTMQLEDLQVEKEDVGLPSPIIILDCVSPTHEGSSHFGIKLTPEHINKPLANPTPTQPIEPVQNQNPPYYVEFPIEDTIPSFPTKISIDSMEEESIISEISHKLTLKRRRAIYLTTPNSGDLGESPYSKRGKHSQTDFSQNTHSSENIVDTMMAEEAGLSMPQLSHDFH